MGDNNIDIKQETKWLDDLLSNKENESKPKKKCPYCQKEFIRLSSHIRSCSEKPDKQAISTMSKHQRLDLEIKDLKIQLEESKEAIKDLVKDFRKLAHHELTEENIIDYFRTVKYAKKYELYRAFTPHDTRLIDEVVNKLHREGTLRRNQNYWYSLNPKFNNKKS